MPYPPPPLRLSLLCKVVQKSELRLYCGYNIVAAMMSMKVELLSRALATYVILSHLELQTDMLYSAIG